ncbi:MAG: hypothetical protein EA393_11495 [Bacteroidetes bacterium]|nr:MAG: hypothetical protein EA393_11495 [Bacteroidota bacterium]
MSSESPLHTSENRIIAGLGLHSSAIIAYQLILMQLISIMQGYHFAYMIISIAMLGFGASGTFLALFRKRLLSVSHWLVPLLMSATGLFMILSFYMARLPALQFDVYLLFVETSQFGVLAATYLIYFLPFFFGALAIGILFIKNAGKIGKYYFANLVGSGLGGILVVLLLNHFFALHTLPIIATLSISAALISFSSERKSYQLPVAFLALIFVLIALVWPGSLPLSEYKGLSRTLNLPEARVIHKQPDVHGQIEVVESPALRYAPALSFTFTEEVPVKKNVFINAEFYGVIPLFDTTRRNIHNYTTEDLPYILQVRDSILILKAGTASGVAHAIQNDAKKVKGITEVQGVKELLKNEFASESGYLAMHEAAELIYNDSRQFLLTESFESFDAIILPRMEAFGGSTGMNALQEDYALTIEAFQLMWDHLSEEGVIAITTWIDYPSRTTLKIANTLATVLLNNGIEQPGNHIAAIKSWGTLSFVLKKTPLNQQEIDNIRTFCKQMLFDPVLLPDIQPEERDAFNILEDKFLYKYLDAIVYEGNEDLLRDYDFYIQPATDDKPYFSRFLKLSSISKLRETFGAETMPFLELGYLIVWVTLLQSALLAFVLIVLPLFRLRKTEGSKTPTLFYFGALGLGYMFAEIIFIQRFILYFGHPVYAISAVISTMMIASGMGSLYSGTLENPVKASRFATFLVAILLFVYSLFFTDILTATINFPFLIKFLIAFVLLALPSFFMGIPFPSGIRILAGNQRDHIPWAWGINGCLSVIATSLATLIAVEQGFRIVMLFAMGFYLLAFFTYFRKKYDQNSLVSE